MAISRLPTFVPSPWTEQPGSEGSQEAVEKSTEVRPSWNERKTQPVIAWNEKEQFEVAPADGVKKPVIAPQQPSVLPALAKSIGWDFKEASGTAGLSEFSGPQAVPEQLNLVPNPSVKNAQNAPLEASTFEHLLDQDTNSIARPGNKVDLLFDGVNSFAERDKIIAGAKESICLQTFIFDSDDTGWALANSLAAKAKQGVKVRVIYDGLGSSRADKAMFEMMKNAGVEIRVHAAPFDEPWNLNARWHEKDLIVDGRVSISGGMNIANEYALGGSGKMVFSRSKTGEQAWRDVDIRLEGPAVNDATEHFLKNWKHLGGEVTEADLKMLLPPLEPQAEASSVRVVRHHPHDGEYDANTDNLYQHSIAQSQHSITIENAYFLPPLEIRQALIAAAKRGVDVNVMTNSASSIDTGFVADAARYFYDDMIEAGVKIYEKQGPTLHSKTASFDEKWSIIGSVNLNGRSGGRDSENALLVTDPLIARQLEERFNTAEVNQVTQAELNSEGFLTNLKQWSLSTLAWTF